MDKRDLFHIGSKDNNERKAIEYEGKTSTYLELSENPSAETLANVTDTFIEIHVFEETDHGEKHYEQIMPDRTKVELSNMHFVPKSHKTMTLFFFSFFHAYFFVYW